MALLGNQVYCACYSEYLSSRDYESFKDFFTALKVESKVKYGTFNTLSEEIINEKGNVREIVRDFVTNKFKKTNQNEVFTKKVLLVDEVDVIFSKDFFGNTYNPLALLVNPAIKNLLNAVWELKKSTKKDLKPADVYAL